ncbi:MAG: rhodanese-like domain-containing protein [Flavobacteriales bacterium]|nr:rhodanese-like domain-containing protein [Flavobacteriales bacterium]
MTSFRIHLVPLCLLVCAQAAAQFAGDGVRYRNISLEDLPAELAEQSGALILDVRSPGEFSDTAEWAGLNIGRLRGAININFKQVPQRLAELGSDKQRPIYVYCSHSRRSRRVSNALADSGYTNVVNVNAGISLYWLEQDRLVDFGALIERNTSYGIINAKGLCEMVATRPVVLLDVRPDSLLAPARRPERVNAMGAIRGSMHIPMAALHDRYNEMPRDIAIVLLDEGGRDAPRAAMLLQENGFTDVHVLFDGLASLMGMDSTRFPCRNGIWTPLAPYRIAPLSELDTNAIEEGRCHVVDVRSEKVYNEEGTNGLRRMNRFRHAVHLPATNIGSRMTEMGIDKATPVVLVGDMTGGPVLDAARTLCSIGYTDVSTLAGGIWGLRWAVHNMDDHQAWRHWLVDP